MNLRRALLVAFFLGSFLAFDSCAYPGPFDAHYRAHPEQRLQSEFLARNSKRIQPQPEWERVYEEVRDCAEEAGYLGEHLEYDEIRWYWAEELWWLNKILYRGVGAYGVYLKPGTIVLSRWAYLRQGGVELTVRHELLHHVSSEPGHPVPLFRRCGP